MKHMKTTCMYCGNQADNHVCTECQKAAEQIQTKQEDEHMNINCEQYQHKETGNINYIDDMYQLYLQAQEQTEQFADFDDFLSAVTDQNGLYAII